MPEISVIVPVYQAEALLRRSVESVLAQTFSDWELLLIDDGSRDGSGAICDEYAARDGRIRVFHTENGGVSAARNLGLDEARGEALAFLDADDAYDPRALETLSQLRRSAGADTAGCAHRTILPGGGAQTELLLPEGVYDAEAIRQRIVLPLAGDRLVPPIFNGFVWRYLFSREIVRRAAIRFEGAYLEDELFLLEYFCSAASLAVTERPLYDYYYNPASATHRYMADYEAVFSAFLARKTALAERYGLDAQRPLWRENTLWAGLLIAIGNEYAKGSPKSLAERQRAVERLCAEPETAAAIAKLAPRGLGRSKQIVADLVRHRRFGILTTLYRIKNRL